MILPGLGLLLLGMTCLEDRLFGDPGPPRHTRRGHLRLLPGGRAHAAASPDSTAPDSTAPEPSASRSSASGRRDAA
ncbi:hypothetical protein ACFUIW_32325 [Streptomyces sp. NPDC057245]|uniref:hypothetical protein n=1 Tax=Streptomyces sp. NPDC057245 TaxID=3346065 RepID=UPI003624F84E